MVIKFKHKINAINERAAPIVNAWILVSMPFKLEKIATE